MASIGPETIPGRDDPQYIDYLENQLKAAKKQAVEPSVLTTIMQKLQDLEVSVNKPPAPIPHTGIPTTTTTTTVTTSSWSGAPVTLGAWSLPRPATTYVSTVSGAAPWSAPPIPAHNPWTYSTPVTTSVNPGWSYTPRSTVGYPPGLGYQPSVLPPLSGIHRPVSTSSTYSSPADVMGAPLTSALEKLSQAIEPTVSTSTKGIQLRPEYYIQHVDQGIAIKSLDHTKLTYRELLAGMCRVLDHLVTSGGDANSYLQHMVFVTKQASVHQFTDAAYVAYDRSVVDKVAKGTVRQFVAGDTLAVASHFHVGNLSVNQNINKRPTGRGRGYRGRRSSGPDHDRESPVTPEGFPSDICYHYNYRVCSAANCAKQHICRTCKGSHRAQGCHEKKEQPARK